LQIHEQLFYIVLFRKGNIINLKYFALDEIFSIDAKQVNAALLAILYPARVVEKSCDM